MFELIRAAWDRPRLRRIEAEINDNYERRQEAYALGGRALNFSAQEEERRAAVAAGSATVDECFNNIVNEETIGDHSVKIETIFRWIDEQDQQAALELQRIGSRYR